MISMNIHSVSGIEIRTQVYEFGLAMHLTVRTTDWTGQPNGQISFTLFPKDAKAVDLMVAIERGVVRELEAERTIQAPEPSPVAHGGPDDFFHVEDYASGPEIDP